MHAATNADMHEKVIQKLIAFFRDFVLVLGVLRPPGGSLEEGTENDLKNLLWRPPFILGLSFGAFWFPNLIFCAFYLCQFLCLFLASLLGGLWQHFWGFRAHSREAFGIILQTFLQMLWSSKNAILGWSWDIREDMKGALCLVAVFHQVACRNQMDQSLGRVVVQDPPIMVVVGTHNKHAWNWEFIRN